MTGTRPEHRTLFGVPVHPETEHERNTAHCAVFRSAALPPEHRTLCGVPVRRRVRFGNLPEALVRNTAYFLRDMDVSEIVQSELPGTKRAVPK